MERDSGLSAAAERQGILVAYPQALKQGHDKYASGWDSSGPADPDAGGIDDGLFVSDLLTVIQAGYCVDPARISATGVSNGGSMAGYLACVLAGRIAAVAPVEGVAVQGDSFASGGHAWFRAIGAAAGDSLLVAFFTRHRLSLVSAPWTPGPALATPVAGGHVMAIGQVRMFRLPERGALPFDLAAGPGGSVWFTEFAANKIGRISVTGAITEFTVPTANAGPYQITAGAGGAMWFSEQDGTIGRVTPDGHVSAIALTSPGSNSDGIAAGPGNTIWVTEPGDNAIAKIFLA
jgi:hypothetical protein